jgi:hypothetical protein
MIDQLVDQWERDYRAAAMADGYAMLTAHLERLSPQDYLGRPVQSDEAESMVEATVCVVRMCFGYATIDNQADAMREFLSMQRYAPADETDADYVLTFDLCGKAFARVLVPASLDGVDLADIYGSPWSSYEVVGFNHLWITRPDWRDLTANEVDQLENLVANDLFFDYSDEEIEVQFDDSVGPSRFIVTVYDL